MPAGGAPAAGGTGLCRRCHTHEASIVVRTEPLCKACLAKYVETKVAKRMGSFRARSAESGKRQEYLLAFSFGLSSLCLLHILSLILKGQAEKSGRTGFRLHVLHIEDVLSLRTHVEYAELLKRIELRYPEHEFSSLALSSLLTSEEVPIVPRGHHKDGNRDESADNHSLTDLLSSTQSATSQADLQQLMRTKAIVSYAKSHGYEAALWGDSTTRLAERTLADTAKGRGLSLPWAVADGESPHGISFCYPLRDLLSKELSAYLSFVEPSIDHLAIAQADITPIVSSRKTTIDDLMHQYFASVEKEYPSIVANVVKTAGKLQPLSLDEVEQQCELCEMPLQGSAPEKSRLCYGCIRLIPTQSG